MTIRRLWILGFTRVKSSFTYIHDVNWRFLEDAVI